jgi:pyrroloquinoline quinone biosynthesis protein E
METQRRAGVSESGPLPSKTTAAAVRRAPLGLLAELTHRCPLQCPYCSNPLHLDGVGAELDTGTWQDVMRQAAQLGVLQVHLSGGEPTARRDLEEIVASAADAGLYTNLITAGVLLDRARTEELAARGLDHVQLSIQDVEPANADRIARRKGAHDKKREVARWIREIGLPLTVNATVHRQNLDRLEGIIAFAVEAGAGRLEIAHVQYYGWALANRAALMPTRAQVERSLEIVEEARAQLKGVLVIDFVVPDYYATWPKPCMGGWGRGIVNVTPSGKVLPCHAAETIPGLEFDNVRDKPLAQIWLHGQAFERFRGTDWMVDPCRSCERREIDWGGCRCQAFALAGDAAAADPACVKSSRHAELVALAEREAAGPPAPFVYRRPRRRPSLPAGGAGKAATGRP